jgi:hypothetical protein
MPKRSGQFRQVVTAGVGVFALLLQLFLSFGHVHARDPFAARVLLSQRQAAVDKSSPGQNQVPSGIPSDDCPICATLHMAGSGLLPALPVVEHPAEFADISHHAFLETIILGVTRHFLFQTRAPPIA